MLAPQMVGRLARRLHRLGQHRHRGQVDQPPRPPARRGHLDRPHRRGVAGAAQVKLAVHHQPAADEGRRSRSTGNPSAARPSRRSAPPRRPRSRRSAHRPAGPSRAASSAPRSRDRQASISACGTPRTDTQFHSWNGIATPMPMIRPRRAGRQLARQRGQPPRARRPPPRRAWDSGRPCAAPPAAGPGSRSAPGRPTAARSSARRRTPPRRPATSGSRAGRPGPAPARRAPEGPSCSSPRMMTLTVCADSPVIRAMSDLASAPCWRTRRQDQPFVVVAHAGLVGPADRGGFGQAAVGRGVLHPKHRLQAADHALAQDHVGKQRRFAGRDDGMGRADARIQRLAGQGHHGHAGRHAGRTAHRSGDGCRPPGPGRCSGWPGTAPPGRPGPSGITVSTASTTASTP